MQDAHWGSRSPPGPRHARWTDGTRSAALRCPGARTRAAAGGDARPAPTAARRTARSDRARLHPGRPPHPYSPRPHGRPARSALFCFGVGVMHQRPAPACAAAPPSRSRTSCGVRCQLQPASCSTHQIVKVLTCGNPSGARRSARCKSSPATRWRSHPVWWEGARRASARMRSRSALV